MAQLISPFNPNNYNPEQSAGQLPLGKHPVVIESSEVKANKANDGGYLQFNLKIIDGPNAGITGPYRLNLYHADQTTCEIANRQLSAVCHVVNVFGDLTSTDPLHNIPFIVEVVPQKNKPEYTQVSKVFDINGNEPGKAPAGQAQTQQPQNQQQPTQGGAGQQWGQQTSGGAWGGAGGQQQHQQPEQTQQQQQQPQNQWQAPQGGQQPAWGNSQQQQPQGTENNNGWQQQQPQNNGNSGTPWGRK